MAFLVRSRVPSRSQSLSIFAHSLDRAALVAYFLGAIVPLTALAHLIYATVLPEMRDSLARTGLVALLFSLAVLSGGSFLLLRRVTLRTVRQMDADKERLAVLLDASEALAAVAHGSDASSALVASALQLGGGPAAFFVAGPVPKLEAAAGDRALHAAIESQLGEIVTQALDEGRAALWQIGAHHGAVLPVDGFGALVAMAPPRGIEAASLRALTTLAAQGSVSLRRVQLVQAQRNFFVHVTDILVAALDAHMDLQAGHARRVAQLANRIGRELGLGETERQRLHFASLLHDVGMLRLDPTQFEDRRIARQHPVLGHRMLAPIQLWADIAPLVLHHHEWFDGSGYPEQLAGETIPLESRVIALAEAFDSMTSAASYKPSIDRDEAVRRITEASGAQFDPDVVRVFLDLARRGDLDLI